MKDLRNKLKEMRKSKKLTQAEIADKLGMTQQQYQKIESGTTPEMQVTTLKKICKTLEISADWLLGLSEDK